LLIAGALALLVTGSAPPAAGEEAINCEDAKNTVEMNVCADKDFAAADAKLNGVYKTVIEHIADSDLEQPYDRKSWDEAMRVSQRAWVAFRDADCKGAVPMEWSGGTGTSAAVAGCMAQKTLTRTKDLQERYGIE
jgi:uncharacterized protein YecT (DUF1311 family)